MNNQKKALVILSGGIDSITLVHYLLSQNYSVSCVSFLYGQKQAQELSYASGLTKKLNLEHRVIDISFMQKILTPSALTNPDIAVPHGEYTKENMLITVVPNRNTMMLSLAWTIACVEDATVLAYGAQTGDHYIYADTRPDYLSALNLALRLGTEDSRNPKLNLIAPFLSFEKHQVIELGLKLGVDYTQTYSCYEGDDLHCGLCGACQSRKKAYAHLNITDPINYKA